MRRWRRFTLIYLALGAAHGASFADDPARPRGGGGYAYLYLGGFDGARFGSSVEEDEGGSFGGGYGIYLREFLATEFEATVFGTDYASQDLSLLTGALMLNLKALHSFGRLRPSAGVGAGLGVTSLDRPYESGTYRPYEEPLEEEVSVLTQLILGVDVRITRRGYLGLEFRSVTALDSFKWMGREIEPDGDSFLLTYRHEFK